MTTVQEKGASEPDNNNIPLGIAVAVGGNEDKEREIEVLKSIVELVEKTPPQIEVITVASEIPEEVGKMYIRAFKKLGVKNVSAMHISSREHGSDDENIRRIQEADIIYFTGGDQKRITSLLGGTPLLKLIKQRYNDYNCVVGGTSAGASAFSKTMIYEGEGHEGLKKGTLKMTSGIGLVPDAVIDSHFIKRGRFSRLMEAMISNPGIIGIGLEEDSGIIIRDGHLLETIGSGVVVIIDGHSINYSNISEVEMGSAIAVENVTVHTMVKGHGFDLEDGRYLKPSDLEELIVQFKR